MSEDASTITPEQPNQDDPAKDDTDWKAEARKWETRAKANSQSVKRLAEIEKASKASETESEKLASQIKDLQAQLDASNLTALRARVQASHQISDEDADLFLTGTDEDVLTRQAQALAQRDAERSKKGPFVPTQGNQPDPSQQGGELREFTRNLFGKKT